MWRACFRAGLVLFAAVALAGCALAVARVPVPDAATSEIAQVRGMTGVRAWADYVPSDLAGEMQRRLPNLPRLGQSAELRNGRPVVDILALSGGGGDGAFGAGLLAGWTARGDRPEFEVVTGVSAGAIIAPFAFLGPRYDRQLEAIWTEYETSELVITQILPGLLGGPALADTGPLKALIARYIDQALLVEVARQYGRGRMLLVGTTNLDAQRPVVWNMGEIARLAARGNAEAGDLFRRVIMASAAIPGAFPPEHIAVTAAGKDYEELHVDGGATREMFVAPVNVPFAAFDRFYPTRPHRRLFIVKNGKINPDYQAVPEKAIAIAGRAVSTLLKAQHLSDIYRVYRMACDDGAEFKLAAVPASFDKKAKEAFDPAYQRALFEEGRKFGRTSSGWLAAPPGERSGCRRG